jgi:hypothetical protein
MKASKKADLPSNWMASRRNCPTRYGTQYTPQKETYEPKRDQPCFSSHVNAPEIALNIKPVQKTDCPRAALIDRKYRYAPMIVP